MAETMLVAFGRYLRTLRERRQYSLDDVASLTRLSPDPILKGYLSRCENGHTRIGFSKMNTLCQVYEVPLDVIAERHSLDMELDKIGGPETDGKNFEDRMTNAATAFKQGRRWDAYAQMRDALVLAESVEVLPSFRDSEEQVACIQMNVATTAAALGKARYALFELRRLETLKSLGPTYHPILLERLAARFLAEGDNAAARKFSELAIAEAERVEAHPYLGTFLFSRARIAGSECDPERSIEFYQKAYEVFSRAGRRPECANTLLNIAQQYYEMRRFRSARRAIASAERLALSVKSQNAQARARILLGEIDDIEGKSDEAASRWREAVQIAKQLNDKVLHFKAEYRLYEQMSRLGNRGLASAFERRLTKLAHWIPSNIEELQEFRAVCGAGKGGERKRVPFLQSRSPSRRNPSSSHSLM